MYDISITNKNFHEIRNRKFKTNIQNRNTIRLNKIVTV